MASKQEQQILDKIKIVLTQQFNSPEEAFQFFDEDGDGILSREEVVELLKHAEVNRFLRGVVATKLMEKFDASSDEFIAWTEFEDAVGQIV